MDGRPHAIAWDTSSATISVDTEGNRVVLNGLTEFDAPDPTCDFDGGGCGISDVDLLTAAIVSGSSDLQYNVNGIGGLDLADLTRWLELAGAENLDTGNPYLPGDANLDGSVDVADFNFWNANKFTDNDAWSGGNFNADAFVNDDDFRIWNDNRFTSAGIVITQSPVPEPTGSVLLVVLGGMLMSVWHERSRRVGS